MYLYLTINHILTFSIDILPFIIIRLTIDIFRQIIQNITSVKIFQRNRCCIPSLFGYETHRFKLIESLALLLYGWPPPVRLDSSYVAGWLASSCEADLILEGPTLFVLMSSYIFDFTHFMSASSGSFFLYSAFGFFLDFYDFRQHQPSEIYRLSIKDFQITEEQNTTFKCFFSFLKCADLQQNKELFENSPSYMLFRPSLKGGLYICYGQISKLIVNYLIFICSF